MHNIIKYKKKIIESGDTIKIDKMLELDQKAICVAHDVQPEMTKWLKLEYRELSNGCILDVDMVEEVMPSVKWTIEETNSVKESHKWNCDNINFYFMANHYYHKFSTILEEDKILEMANLENKMAYHIWKIKRMYR